MLLRAIALLLPAAASALVVGQHSLVLEQESREADGAGKTRPPWPFLEQSSPSAFVYMAHNLVSETMYDPVLFTVGEGLFRAGASVALVTKDGTQDMLQNISLAVASGKQVTVVAIAYLYSGNSAPSILAKAKQAGAYIVLYQTEPGQCVSRQMLGGYHADEVWDYSHANLQCCYSANPGVKARYMPPGYTQAWDLDVDLHSAKRNSKAVGFLGGICCGRMNEWYRYISSFRGAHAGLVQTWGVWSPQDLKQWVESHPIQLNFHKNGGRCSSGGVPLEAFRLSTLLSNKGCVISAMSNPEDMKQFRDIVHFAAAGDEGTAFEELSNRSIECQEESYRIFKERFDPLKLLRESGFLGEALVVDRPAPTPVLG